MTTLIPTSTQSRLLRQPQPPILNQAKPALSTSLRNTISVPTNAVAPRFGMFGVRSTIDEANNLHHVQTLLATESSGPVAIDIIPKTDSPEIVTLIAQRFLRDYGTLDKPIFQGNQSTMLHSLVTRGKTDLVPILVDMGADPMFGDMHGATALDRIEKILAKTPKATRELKQRMREILENPPPKPVRQPWFQWPENPLSSFSTITGYLSQTASRLYGALPALPTFSRGPGGSSEETHSTDANDTLDDSTQPPEDRPTDRQGLLPELQVALPLEPKTTVDRGVQVDDTEKQHMQQTLNRMQAKNEKLRQRLTDSEQQQQTRQEDFSSQKTQLTQEKRQLAQENRRLRQDLEKVNQTAEQTRIQLQSDIEAATLENQTLRQELKQQSETQTGRIKNLETERQSLQQELTQSRDAIERHRRKANDARQKIEKTEQRLKSQQAESRRNHTTHKQQREQAQQLEQDNQQLRKTLEEVQSHHHQQQEELTRQLEALQRDNQSLHVALSDSQTERQTLSESTTLHETTAKKLQNELETARRSHHQNLNRLHQQKHHLNRQVQDLQVSLEHSGQQAMQNHQWYAYTAMENQTLRGANASFAQNQDWFASALQEVQQENIDLQTQLATIQAERDEAREQQRHPQMVRHVGQLMSETADLRVRNHRLQEDLQALQTHLSQDEDAQAEEQQDDGVDTYRLLKAAERQAVPLKRSQSFSL